jgi:site-specific DNA recombinase
MSTQVKVPAGIYVRLSVVKPTERLTEDALERQEEGARELCERKGWTVREVYTDSGVSAFRGKHRGEFERALADLERGHIKVLVVFKLDRVIRNMWDLLRLERVLEQSGGILASCHDDWGDTSTAAGRFMLRTFASLAEMESENISLRVTAQHRQRAYAGKPIVGGNRPFGWSRDRTEVIPEEAAVVVECARRVLQGQSLRSVVAWANTVCSTTTGQPWSHKSMKRLLTAPSTAGKREYHGQEVAEGNWTPLLDEQTWLAVRAILRDPARARPGQPARHLLSGFVFCSLCGAKMLTHWPKQSGRQYSCSKPTGCGRLAIAGAQLEELVSEALLIRLAGPGLSKALEQVGRQREDQMALLTERDAARARRDEIEVMFSSGLIQQDAFVRMHGPAVAKVQQIQARLDQMNGSSVLAELPDGEAELQGWWNATGLEQRRSVLRSTVERVVISSALVRGRRFDPARVDVTWLL